MKRSFAGYAVFLGAFIVFYGVVATGAFGYVDRIPAIEDIESVSFEDNTYYQEFGSDHFDIQGEQYENLASVKPEICQAENVEKVLEFHRSVVEFQKQAGFPFRMSQGGGIQYQIVYHLKDGSTFQREYQWSPFDTPNAEENSQRLQQLSSDIVNSEEYKTSGNLLFYLEPGDISQIEIENYDEQSDMAAKTYRLNDAQKQALLEALRQDTLDLDITNREDFSGHAYNYVQLEEKWYLSCTTFGSNELNFGSEEQPDIMLVSSYNMFLTTYETPYGDEGWGYDSGMYPEIAEVIETEAFDYWAQEFSFPNGKTLDLTVSDYSELSELAEAVLSLEAEGSIQFEFRAENGFSADGDILDKLSEDFANYDIRLIQNRPLGAQLYGCILTAAKY